MTLGDEVFDRLAPAHGWTPDWPDVLARAGVNRRARLVTKRRLVIVFVVLAAVLVPLVALGGANDWWFVHFGGPTPTQAPQVVQEGNWDGHPWQMTAYPSSTDGLCVAITPTDSSNGAGGAQECGTFAGIPRTAETTKDSSDMTITYLAGTPGSSAFPAYIVGPVIDKAATVELRFANGATLRVPTFAGTQSLTGVRFYATPLPGPVVIAPGASAGLPKWIAGLDTDGTVVACLVPATAKNGLSPLAACR
jgi:hypothetical protein